jgi:hypothetical protein
VSDRIIYSGDAGTTFTNETGRVLYQFIAALQNTCGLCLQYHLKISAAWPIPLHYNCRCIQRMIKPGQTAQHEFCDYRKLLDAMPEHEKAAAIGASNYRLLKSGLAKWEDIVTPNRVRDFREVVAKKNLSVKQMVAHGVKPYQAQQAYSAVHTAEHEHVERQRRELLQKLTGAGLSQENLVNELSKRLAARVTIAAGPTGPYTEGPAWSGGPLPGIGPSGAAGLAALISGWKPGKKRAAMPKQPVKSEPVPDQTPISQQRTADEAKAIVDQMEPVSSRGKPRPDGEYIRTDQFMPLADEATENKLAGLTNSKPVSEWAKSNGKEQEVPIDSLIGSQTVLRRSSVVDNLNDPDLLSQPKGGDAVAFLIDGKLVIEDGHHRIAAMKARGATSVKVIVVQP